MSKTKIIPIIIAVVVLSGSAVWLIQSYRLDKSFQFSPRFLGGGGQSGQSGQAAIPVPSVLPQTYIHPGLGFSFSYPQGFKVSSMAEELGETILVQKEGSAKEGFQIFISEFDEPGPISKERIKQDLPEMVIETPQRIILAQQRHPEASAEGSPADSSAALPPQNDGKGGVSALIFFSQDESFGKTREVWFIHNGQLYQITAPAEFEEELSKIMATFRFE